MTKYSNAPFLNLADGLTKDHLAYSMNYNLSFEDERNGGLKAKFGTQHIHTSPSQSKLIASTYERDVWLLDQTERLYERLWVSGEGTFMSGLGAPHVSEAGVLIHTVYGVPYLNASSIKGMVRDWTVAAEVENDLINRLFGTTEDAGLIQFWDVVFCDVTLEPDIMTPHYGKYYNGSSATDTDSPIPISFFRARVNRPAPLILTTSSRASKDDLELATECVIQAFSEFGYGAKTTSGYGRFTVTKEANDVKSKRWKAIQEEALEAEQRASEEKKRIEGETALMQRVAHLSQNEQQLVLELYQELQTAMTENKQELVDALKAKEKLEVATRFPKEVGTVYRQFAKKFGFWEKPSKKLIERLKPLKEALKGINE